MIHDITNCTGYGCQRRHNCLHAAAHDEQGTKKLPHSTPGATEFFPACAVGTDFVTLPKEKNIRRIIMNAQTRKQPTAKTSTENKKLSKTGLFLRSRPDGIILDMKAVLK